MSETLKGMPELHSTVMFRLCTQHCLEKLPKLEWRPDAERDEAVSRWLEERAAGKERGEATGPDARGRRL